MSLARNIIRILNEADNDDMVLSRIETCLTKTKGKILDLSKLGLTEIPQEVFKLTGLVELNLSNNRLSELPVEVFGLDKLKELDISNNLFTNLPHEELIAMSMEDSLEILVISGNKNIPKKTMNMLLRKLETLIES
jgi:Leucine-rich repeat (LRR) protein